MNRIGTFIILLLFSSEILAQSISRENASVYFITPEHNQTLSNPINLSFGVNGMKLKEAGINAPYSGHHHLLVDLEELPALDKPIPSDKQHIHFGKGQKSAVIDLPPGKHTLQLLFADYLHVPHDKPLISKKITIMVTE